MLEILDTAGQDVSFFFVITIYEILYTKMMVILLPVLTTVGF
jgi:hypothetical protein